jgi:hypothetical protein
VWEVYLSNQKDPYLLDEIQFAIFKDAILKGVKTTIAFDKFGINLSYFVSYSLRSRKLRDEYQLKSPTTKEPTKEERIKADLLLQEIRRKLKVQLGVSGVKKRRESEHDR